MPSGINTTTAEFLQDVQSILFKKYAGFVNTALNTPTNGEYSINAYPVVYLNKLYIDPIPAISTKDLLDVSELNFDGNGGKKYYSSKVPYIVKYENVTLTSYKGSTTTYMYDANFNKDNTGASDASDNILTDAIPSTLDPGGSYGTVMTNNTGAFIDPQYYVIDKEAGVVTFFPTAEMPTISVAAPPKIRYWRYEGRKGNAGIASDWYKYGAKSIVDMCGSNIKGLPTICGSTLLADVSDNYAASIGFVKKYIDICGGGLGSGSGSGMKYTDISFGGVSYKTWDASNALITNLADLSLSRLTTDLSKAAINANTLNAYLTTNNYLSISGNRLDLSSVRIDASSVYVNNVNFDASYADISKQVINVASLQAYVPNGAKRGNYLMWDASGAKTWTAMSGDSVLLGENVPKLSDLSGKAVVIGGYTNQTTHSVGSNSIVIGANAKPTTGNIPANSIILNATGADISGITKPDHNDVLMYVPKLNVAPRFQSTTKALYYDPATGIICAGEISGVTIYRDDAGDPSGWYKYPAEQAINMRGTPNATDLNYIFNLKTPPKDLSEANGITFKYDNAITGISGDISAASVYTSMATTVGWVQGYVKNELSGANLKVDISGWAKAPAVQQVDMSRNRIYNMSDPSDNRDAVTKQYVDMSYVPLNDPQPVSVTSWLQKYVIDAPPAPIFEASGASSTSLTLQFKNPSQMYVGAFDMQLPAIKNINIKLYHNVANSTHHVLQNDTTYLPATNPIRILTLVKYSDTRGTGYTPGTDTYVWKYPSNVSNGYDNPASVEIWYENGNPNIKKLTALIGPFVDTGIAGQPRSLAIGTNDDTQPTISFLAPTLYDATNSVAASGQLLYYKVRFVPTATLRATTNLTSATTTFPTQSLTNITEEVCPSFTSSAHGTTSITFTPATDNKLFPSTTYTYYVNASNDNSTFSNEVSSSFTTSGLALTSASINLSIAPSAIKAGTDTYYHKDNHNSKINATLISKGSSAALNTFDNFNIHNTSNRGSTNTNIASLTLSIQKNSQQDGQSTIAELNGFNNNNSNITTQDRIDVSFTDENDVNTGDLRGYYKKIDITPTIKTSPLTAGNDAYSFTASTNNTDANNINGSPLDFRVEDFTLVANPSISYTNFSAVYKQVSGVSYLNTGTLSTTIILNNFINNFYRNNPLSISLYDSNTAIISASNTDARSTLNGTTITGNNVSTTYSKTFTYGANTFSKELKIKTDAYLVDSTPVTTGKTDTRSIMLDAATIALVGSSKIASTENNIAINSYSYGYRRHITNDATDTNTTGMFAYANTAPINGTASYNDLTLLTNNLALQISKGYFTTYIANNAAYDNYNTLESNLLVNYSDIRSGTRYAAFSWNGPSTSSNYSGGITIRLNNVEVNGNAVVYNSTTDTFSVGGKTIGVYYRMGNGTSALSESNNTIWLNATKGSNSLVNGNTPPNNNTRYTTPSFNKIIGGLQTGGYTYNSTAKTIEFNVLSDVGINNTRVFVLIEVPMDADFRFDSVSLKAVQ